MGDATRESGRVTLKRVAGKAGVSLATASKVMNGHEDVSEATTELVKAAARDLGYSVRRAGSGHRRAIVIRYDTLRSVYALEVLEGAESAARRANADLLLVSGGRGEEGFEKLSRAWMAELRARGIDALITVTSPTGPRQARWSRELGLPLIAIDPVVDGEACDGLVSISATNWEGGASAVKHLLKLGHRRIGVLGGPVDSTSAQQRLQGYLSALGQAGVRFDQELVTMSSFRYEDGELAADQLLRLPEPPTAIFAVADTLGLGALRSARKLGFHVPDQLSVVSFDDTMIAHWTHPQLTAVRQPLFQMGQVAVERALALSADPGLFAHAFKLETGLVERESTARFREL